VTPAGLTSTDLLQPASFGSGWLLYTMESKPWLAANRGNAESARRPP
jgi:hypothetical protein